LKVHVFRHVDTAFTARHIVSAASSETGFAGALQRHVPFICRKIVGRERRQGKQVENKERQPVCLTMKNHGLKTFYASLHFK